MRRAFTKYLKALSVLGFVLCWQSVLAQVKISGKVVSDNGEALPGANVVIKGTSTGTITDFDGNYSLEVPGKETIVVYSFVGYAPQEVTVGLRTAIDVALAPDVTALDELVVIGYGTQKKEDVTGAVVSISSDDFVVGKVQDAAELVKGKIPGLLITKSSGDPNASSSILLRGINTIEGSTAPLILIDGIVGDLNTVTPESIESITVLKDASAAAIYGTRGASGVILITTKGGMRDEPVSVNYSGYVTASNFYKTADFMDAADIRAGLTAFQNDGYVTDWLAAVTQTGVTHKHVVNVSGGTEKTVYSANLSYKNEQGTIKMSNNDEIKVQLGLDNYFLNDRVKLGVKLWKEYHENSINNASEGGMINIYRQAVIHNPTSPIYNEDGSYYEEWNRYQYYNPVSMLNELKGGLESEETSMIGTLMVEPIDHWKTNLMVANKFYNGNSYSYATSNYFSSYTSGNDGSAGQSYGNTREKTLELTSAYDIAIGDHRASALVGYSYFENMNHGFNASNADFPTDTYLYNNLSEGTLLKDGNAGMDSYKNKYNLVSFFGRITYDYKDRYNFLASLRREGSSKFGEGNKWGYFPAVSVGWTLSNESFLSGVSAINNLKFRAGVGVTGRNPRYTYQSLIIYNYQTAWGNYVDENGDWVSSLMPEQVTNPLLKWETTTEYNLGLDFSLFENRIGGSLDAYRQKTEDVLYWYTVPVPPNVLTTMLANGGSFRNQGLELMLTGDPVKTKDFRWNTTITGSRNWNKLLSLSNEVYESESYLNVGGAGDPISVPTQRWEEGSTLGNFWGLKSVGVTDKGIWLIEDPETGEAVEYSTSMNTDTYRQYLGNGMAKYAVGWNNSFQYKNFDLNVQMSGQLGYNILNEQRMFYENNSIQYNRLKSAADPVYGNVPLGTSQAQAFVSYYIENGNYLKFDNATLGYNFNVSKMQNYISKLRLYFSAQNFLIITNYSGLDPELNVGTISSLGQDPRDKYPTIKSFTVGLNVTFK